MIGYSYIQEYIDSIRLYIYGIAVMLYAISSLITITNVFIVFVNGSNESGTLSSRKGSLQQNAETVPRFYEGAFFFSR